MEVVCAHCGREIESTRVDRHLNRAFCKDCDAFTPLSPARVAMADAIRDALAPTREIVPLPRQTFSEVATADGVVRLIIGRRTFGGFQLSFFRRWLAPITTLSISKATISIEAHGRRRETPTASLSGEFLRVDVVRRYEARALNDPTESWDVRLVVGAERTIDLDLKLDQAGHANFVAARIEAAIARSTGDGYRGERK